MTTDLKPGDRVRVTYEGVWESTSSGHAADMGFGWVISEDGCTRNVPKDSTVEKLTPAQPADGSVILDCDGDAWQRRDVYWYPTTAHEAGSKTWEGLNSWYSPITVIYDPTDN